MQSGREDTLEKRYAIKFCFKHGKNARETYGILQTAFGPSCMNRASVFELHKRFKEGRESVRDDERCGRSKEVRTPKLTGQIKNFMDMYVYLFKCTILIGCPIQSALCHIEAKSFVNYYISLNVCLQKTVAKLFLLHSI